MHDNKITTMEWNKNWACIIFICIIWIRPNNKLIALFSFNIIVIKLNKFNHMIKIDNPKQNKNYHAFGFNCLISMWRNHRFLVLG